LIHACKPNREISKKTINYLNLLPNIARKSSSITLTRSSKRLIGPDLVVPIPKAYARPIVVDLVGIVNDPGKRTANTGQPMVAFQSFAAIFARKAAL
jgi:hypothetical protein